MTAWAGPSQKRKKRSTRGTTLSERRLGDRAEIGALPSAAAAVFAHVLVLVLAVALLVDGGAVVRGDERLGLLLEQPDDLGRGRRGVGVG